MNNGIAYFPLDTHMDDKIKLIEAEFGLTGFSVIVKLYQKIYGEQGYYCEWTNDVALLFSRSLGLGGTAVSEIVRAAIRRGIFDEDVYDKYHILTSKGIQKRYFEVVSRRKNVEVKKEYLLVKLGQKYKNVCISGENVNIFEENAYKNEQRKGKERKEKKSSSNATAAGLYDEGLKRVLTEYENNFGVTVSRVHADEIADWRKSVDDDVIIYAMKESADSGARNWRYARSVIENHFAAGRTTIAAVKAAGAERKKNSSGGNECNMEYWN